MQYKSDLRFSSSHFTSHLVSPKKLTDMDLTGLERAALETAFPNVIANTASEPSCCSCLGAALGWTVCDLFPPFLLVVLWNVLPAGIFTSFFYLSHFLIYANPYHTTDGTRPFAIIPLAITFLLPPAFILLNLSCACYLHGKTFGRDLTTATVVAYGSFGLMGIAWFLVLFGLCTEGLWRNYFNLMESKYK